MDYLLVVDPDELRSHLARLRAENAAGRKRLAELLAAATATHAASHAARERRRHLYRYSGEHEAGDAGAPDPGRGDEPERAVEPDPLEADDPDW